MTAEPAPAQQSTSIAALPENLNRAQRSKDFAALPQPTRPAGERTLKQEYQALSVLPQAASRELRFYLNSQVFDYFEDGELFLSGPIASGKADSPTPTGRFSVLSKNKDKESSKYTNMIGTQAWMPYAMQFYGDYFIHEGWLPGYAASHGCIRIDHYHAKLLFERMRIGDPVTVSD